MLNQSDKVQSLVMISHQWTILFSSAVLEHSSTEFSQGISAMLVLSLIAVIFEAYKEMKRSS